MTPEKPNVREFAVGSICEIVKCEKHLHLIGTEVTVLKPLELCVFDNGERTWAYVIDIKIDDSNLPVGARHEALRLKRLPPAEDAWCRETMLKVLESAPLSAKGDVLVKEVEDELYGR